MDSLDKKQEDYNHFVAAGMIDPPTDDAEAKEGIAQQTISIEKKLADFTQEEETERIRNLAIINEVGEIADYFLEKIADVQHNIWSSWMEYLFEVSMLNDDGSYTIPAEKVKRWKTQIAKPYHKLSPGEKNSDKEEALKVFRVFLK